MILMFFPEVMILMILVKFRLPSEALRSISGPRYFTYFRDLGGFLLDSLILMIFSGGSDFNDVGEILLAK